nr:histidine phosphatase family protein [Microbacterium sp. Se5.02b]
MTHLTLVRHGQTDWNLARRIQGSTDIPLNATGREDAARAAEQLATSTHHAVYTSPLLRARDRGDHRRPVGPRGRRCGPGHPRTRVRRR